MNHSDNIKQLKQQLQKEESELSAMSSILAMKQKEVSEKQRLIANLKTKIEQNTPKSIQITDHARVRYIERVMEIDMNAIDALMINELSKHVQTLGGNGTYPLGNHKAVVRNFGIITIK